MMTSNIKELRLVNILNSTPEFQENVRNIRNEEQVRKWMYTDHIISVDEHINWIKRLKNDKKNIVFIVSNENNSVFGVVSINALDLTHKKADWAYYLTGTVRSGVGAVLEFYILDYIFNTIGLDKLNCEVIEHNNTVVRLHEKFGFKSEGFRESNILKNGKRIGVHYLGLTKGRWLTIHPEIKNKYSKIFSQYSIKII